MTTREFIKGIENIEVIYIYVTPTILLRDVSARLLVLTVEEVRLPNKYVDYANVFDEPSAGKLPEIFKVSYSIEIEEGKDIPYRPIYALSTNELRVLREYLKNTMAKG